MNRSLTEHFLKFQRDKLVLSKNGSNHTTEVWSADWASAIDSSFFWGYLVTQIPGGFLASFFPSNRIFGAAIFGSSICNLFIPLSLHVSLYILIIVRVFQGLVEVSFIAVKMIFC